MNHLAELGLDFLILFAAKGETDLGKVFFTRKVA